MSRQVTLPSRRAPRAAAPLTVSTNAGSRSHVIAVSNVSRQHAHRHERVAQVGRAQERLAPRAEPPPRALATSPPCARQSVERARRARSTAAAPRSRARAARASRRRRTSARASRASIRRQLAGRSPACTIVAHRARRRPRSRRSARARRARCSGRGSTRTHASVITASVPSEPSSSRSGDGPGARAGQPPRLPHVAADGQRAHRLDEVVDVRRPGREVPAGARGDPAAERRELERLRVEAQRQPVLGELLLEPRAGRAGLDARGARDRVDLEHAVERAQVDATRARVAAARDARRRRRPRSCRRRTGIDRDVALAAPVEHARAARASSRGRATPSGGCGNSPRMPRTTSRYERPWAWRARSRRPACRSPPARRRLEPRRRQLDVVERHRLLGLRRAEAEVRGDARPRPRALGRRRLLVLVAPAPVLATRARTRGSPSRRPTVIRTHPASSPAAPGSADQVARRWREDAFEPRARPHEAADAAIAALEDRGSPAHDGARRAARRLRARPTARLELELQPMRWSLRLVRERRRRARWPRCAWCARRRPLAGRPARAVGRDLGRALGARRRRRGRGRRGPGRDARARARGGVVGRRPSGSRSRRSCCCPNRHGDAGRPGVAARGRRGHARRRARRARLVAAPTRRLAATRPTRRCCAGWRRAGMSRVLELHGRLKYLSFTHSAIYAVLLVGWRSPGRADARARARLGARHRLDRDVAALHRRRAAARDPALARRDGRRRRRRRTVRREHRVLVEERTRRAGRTPSAAETRMV